MRGGNTYQSEQDFLVRCERGRIEFVRNEMRKEYEKAGFSVVPNGQMKSQPYIDVKVVEAKVDVDFYNRDDDSPN